MLHIRRYREEDAPALFEVYYSAIHLVASRDYTSEQVHAWAPREFAPGVWEGKMSEIQPFVAELDGQVVGYADLQQNGYIDHFFVSGHHQEQGVGTLLMNQIIGTSGERAIAELTSDVSRTAQPFYKKFGFEVVEERQPVVRGIVIPNALMRRRAA